MDIKRINHNSNKQFTVNVETMNDKTTKENNVRKKKANLTKVQSSHSSNNKENEKLNLRRTQNV